MTRQVRPELLERRLADVTEAAVAGLGLPAATESGLPLVDAVGGLAYQQLQAGAIGNDAVAPASIQQGTAGQLLMTNATPDTAWTTVTGDVTITSAGVTAIGAGVIVNADVASAANLQLSKLEDVTAGRVILGNASNRPTATAVTGDVTISSAGVTAIGSGVIVDADVAAGAAITHSKLANITAGSVLMGNASNVPTATALTGDVTVSSSGVTAIGTGVVVTADLSTTTGEIAGVWNSDTVNTGFTNVSSGNVSRRWRIVGKTMHFRLWFTAGTATAAGSVAVPLPASASMQTARATFYHGVNSTTIVSAYTLIATPTRVTITNSTAGGGFGAGASLTSVTVNGTLEIS